MACLSLCTAISSKLSISPTEIEPKWLWFKGFSFISFSLYPSLSFSLSLSISLSLSLSSSPLLYIPSHPPPPFSSPPHPSTGKRSGSIYLSLSLSIYLSLSPSPLLSPLHPPSPSSPSPPEVMKPNTARFFRYASAQKHNCCFCARMHVLIHLYMMSHVMSQLNHYKSELLHYFKSNGTIHGSSNDASSIHNLY